MYSAKSMSYIALQTKNKDFYTLSSNNFFLCFNSLIACWIWISSAFSSFSFLTRSPWIWIQQNKNNYSTRYQSARTARSSGAQEEGHEITLEKIIMSYCQLQYYCNVFALSIQLKILILQQNWAFNIVIILKLFELPNIIFKLWFQPFLTSECSPS